MRNDTLKYLSILFLFACGNNNPLSHTEKHKEKSDTIKLGGNVGNAKEDFDKFFFKFCHNKEFQLERVTFPLVDCFLDTTFNHNMVCDSLRKEQWQHLFLFYDESYVVQFYDNFKHGLRDTDERVYAYVGVENDVAIYYYFKRINELWYLIKRENFSY